MDEFGINDYGEDLDDDSDYDGFGGADEVLYDSVVDDIDELKFLRDTIGQI